VNVNRVMKARERNSFVRCRLGTIWNRTRRVVRRAVTSSSTCHDIDAADVDEPILGHTGIGTTLPRTGSDAFYYHRNQQYSIVGLTNAAGTLVERYSYSAYGTLGIYDASGTVRTTSTYANRYTYTGREYDPDLNLYHFRARWYDPSTGGFISRDPLGYVDGMSLYRGYFAVLGMDPQGHEVVAAGGGKTIYNRPDGTCYYIDYGYFFGDGKMQEVDVPCPDEANVLVADMGSDSAKKVLDNLYKKRHGCLGKKYNIHETYRCGVNEVDYFLDDIENLNDCRCIKELTVHGHGNCGNAGNVDVAVWVTGLKRALFCRPCKIWLNSCQSGVGPDSIASQIQRATGCTVMGTRGYIVGFRDDISAWYEQTRDPRVLPDLKGDPVWQEFAPPSLFPIEPRKEPDMFERLPCPRRCY
jgi:RHS repeat-associated protein